MSAVEKLTDAILGMKADQRAKRFPLMQDPYVVIMMMFVYLTTVYIVMPNFMKNRKPYSLKTLLYYYNLFQIFACISLIYGFLTSGWTTHYTLGCQPIDYSEDPLAVRMLKMMYLTFLLKLIEMAETAFFIMRKKYNQVSKLHVYHHASTATFAWFATTYIGGGMISFPLIVNSVIHVMMYTYYLLSSFGPEWRVKLMPWKRRLTTAQIVQFGILTSHAMQIARPSCNVPLVILPFYLPNFVVLYMMFADFYKNNYLKNTKRTNRQENELAKKQL